MIVSVRLEDANNEPDARNDAGVTVVGKPVRLDVLANDTDPDNDPLFVAQQPTLVRPTDRTIDSLDLSLTPDGELFFDPDAAGTYVFNYSATDGEETDVAQIRIEVGAATENRPPIADPRRRRDRRRRLAAGPRARQRRRSRRRRHRPRRRTTSSPATG